MLDDLPRPLPDQVPDQSARFFQHPKDPQANERVEVKGGVGAEMARADIIAGVIADVEPLAPASEKPYS